MAWATVGTVLTAISAPVGTALAIWGAASHLWGDSYFLAGFAASCALTALGLYALIGEFFGGIGPLPFPLPPTRHERAARNEPAAELRLLVPRGPIPRVSPRSHGRTPEIQRIHDQLAQAHVREREQRLAQLQRQAEGQLAAALRSGHLLHAAGSQPSPLQVQWRAQTQTLVKELFGDLEAARLTGENLARRIGHLDELAAQVPGEKALAPGKSWDAWVEALARFDAELQTNLSGGEELRAIFFADERFDRGESDAAVKRWLGAVEQTFAIVPELRAMVRNVSPAGASAGYEGLSEEQAASLWPLDLRLEELRPLVSWIREFVAALQGGG